MGISNASNGAKSTEIWNEGKLEGVNVAPGSHGQWLAPHAKEAIKKAQEEYDKKQKQKQNKKNRKK